MTTLEYQDFITLEKADIVDAQEYGLAIRLETRPSPTTGQVHYFGCLLDESQARQLSKGLASAVEGKWGKENG